MAIRTILILSERAPTMQASGMSLPTLSSSLERRLFSAMKPTERMDAIYVNGSHGFALVPGHTLYENSL